MPISTDRSPEGPTVRVIKRYANRKLYDTHDSRYVTLQQIAEHVRAGDDVSIIGHDDAVPRPRGLDTLPALTVTRSPLVQACTPLADKIHALLAGTPSAELQTIARTELIIRATTGPIHGALPWT